jgi:hypothetical protein
MIEQISEKNFIHKKQNKTNRKKEPRSIKVNARSRKKLSTINILKYDDIASLK